MTARAERFHIGIFGRRNSGKSSLLNSLTGQESSIVSQVKGTTTDPIYKPMEIHGLGPVVFIDTAGLDDEGDLGGLRIEKTIKAIDKCDAFIYLLSEDDEEFIEQLSAKNKPIIYVVSKGDLETHKKVLEENSSLNPLVFISGDKDKKEQLIERIREHCPRKKEISITHGLVDSGDTVLLVMPQDESAPKGRLIMPQVQTIRELLDKNAVIYIANLNTMGAMLASLKFPPNLIITDSQYFEEVSKLKPEESLLTSFSVLFSAYKGDIDYFIESVKVLDEPEKITKILIAEACTHAPLEEDIGRVKIPNLLRKKFNKDFEFTFKRGDDFDNLEEFDLIIHCGSCMFNRSNVLNRVEKAKNARVPMTNYGIMIAYLKGILDDISITK